MNAEPETQIQLLREQKTLQRDLKIPLSFQL
jgi:hypothetical protein